MESSDNEKKGSGVSVEDLPNKRGLVLSSRSKAILLALDFLILLFCVSMLYSFRLHDSFSVSYEHVITSTGFLFIAITHVTVLYVFGAYDLERVESFSQIQVRTVVALLVSAAIVIVVNFFAGKEATGVFGRGILLGGLLLTLSVEISYRYALWRKLQAAQRHLQWLFVGTLEVAQALAVDLRKNKFNGQIAMLLDQPQNFTDHGPCRVLGSWDDLPKFLDHSWMQVILGIDQDQHMKQIGPSLMAARFAGHKVKDLNQFYEARWRKVPIYYLNHSWFVLADGFGLIRNPIGLRLKRVIDIILSSVLLILAWPLMLLTAVAIRIEGPGPLLFSQNRIGKSGVVFVIYKFRSMRTDAEVGGAKWAAPRDARITRVGYWIRQFRLDELPQLFNVLKGEMSFIGPRPEQPDLNLRLEDEIPYYNLRHLVNPGVTGWAQVMYPYGASVEDAKEKLQYELYYIKNYTLWMDLQIVLRTIGVVLAGRGR